MSNTVTCPLPGVLAYDTQSTDQVMRNLTFNHFGLGAPYSDLTDPLAGMDPNAKVYWTVRRGEKTERCQVSGIYFPVSMMTVDGLGRRVGRPFMTRKGPDGTY